MAGVVTLLTDFGLVDPFVGIVHGVILSRCPTARIVDLSHGIAPHDLIAAALAWSAAWRYFPPGTVHLAVVDPGVGSTRRLLAAELDGQVLLCPDNGVLGLALDAAAVWASAVYAVHPGALAVQPVSATFHGRDLFAPLAAALAGGARPADFGVVCDDWQRAALPRPQRLADGWHGELLLPDRFGNALSNLPAHLMQPGSLVRCADQNWPFVACYADAAPGARLAIVGSSGRIELCRNGGDAWRSDGLVRGQRVLLSDPWPPSRSPG
jgi:hypothetical protein